MRHDKRSLTFSESQVRQYFLSLLSSANTGPGVIDFGLFFRSQVPGERLAFLFINRTWRKSEIDLLYPHPPSIMTLLISRPPLGPIARSVVLTLDQQKTRAQPRGMCSS